MVNIKIPKHVMKGFASYLKLSKEDKVLLLTELKNIPIEIGITKIPDYVTNKLGKLFSYDMLSVAISFIGIDEETNLKFEQLSKSFNEALKEANLKEKLELGAESEKSILDLLLTMNSGNFLISKKARDLEMDRTNLMSTSKIITDVRPVFGGKDEDEIMTSVLLYNLRFTYKEDNSSNHFKNIYFSLDENDLASLKEQIVRAEKKAKEIKKRYEKISFH